MGWLRRKVNRALPATGVSADVSAGAFGRAPDWTPDWPAEASSGAPECLVPAGLAIHRPEVIAQLAAELCDTADALRYRDNFARLLPERIEAVTAALRSKDEQAAIITLHSLEVGSHMVGAPRLELVVSRCLADVREGRKADCLPGLVREAERFLTCLTGSSGPGHPAIAPRYDPPVQF